MSIAMPRLRIEGLGVTYASARGRLPAVNNLNLSVGDGEFVAVLGPSGCGKSTLLNIASGLLAPSRGKVEIQGQAVKGPRRDVGIVFQQPTLLPWKTVLENVLVPVAAMGQSTADHMQRARDLLRLVRLEAFENHYPHELSGGMQQRVGIARALTCDPAMLLMDEPMAALDALTRETIQELLLDIWRQTNKMFFFITHSVEEALFLGSRLIVMSPRPGRITHTFEPAFNRRYLETRDGRGIKSSPDFIAMREQVLGIIYGDELAAAPQALHA
jgi:taurine transport system ATP-binding protein